MRRLIDSEEDVLCKKCCFRSSVLGLGPTTSYCGKIGRGRGRTPHTPRSWGLRGLMLCMKFFYQFLNVFNRPHRTKSWLCHWILFINTHSAVSQIQSIRQILPLSLDIPMLKSSQLQGGGLHPSDPRPGALPLDTAGGCAPEPLYILSMGPHSCIGGGVQLSSAGTENWLVTNRNKSFWV